MNHFPCIASSRLIVTAETDMLDLKITSLAMYRPDHLKDRQDAKMANATKFRPRNECTTTRCQSSRVCNASMHLYVNNVSIQFPTYLLTGKRRGRTHELGGLLFG